MYNPNDVPFRPMKEPIGSAHIRVRPDTVTMAEELLTEAGHTITGDRQDDYGDPAVNFNRIATLWGAYMGDRVRPTDRITAADVAMLMALVKVSRLANTPGHQDSYVDLIGYVALGGALSDGQV